MIKTTVATRLKESRDEAGLTQTELAKKARLKNQSIIGSLESGHRKTSSHLPAIAAALGVESLWLSDGRGPKRASSGAPQQLFEEPTDAPLLVAYRQAGAVTRAAVDLLLLPMPERKRLDDEVRSSIRSLESQAIDAMRREKKTSRAA